MTDTPGFAPLPKVQADIVEGVGETLDAALLDALRFASESAGAKGARIEVVSFGAEEGVSGGARQIWVKARRL